LKEDKHNRFRRLAEKRTNKIIEDIRILGNCSNRSNYYYTKDEIDKVFSAIVTELKETRNKFIFKNKLNKKTFKLQK